jgi:hypothetical protein
MTNPDYSDRINIWDHNIVCKALLDIRSPLSSKIILVGDSCRYNGYVTLELLAIMER